MGVVEESSSGFDSSITKEGDEGDDESLIQTFAHPLIIHGHMSHIKAFGFFLHCPFFFPTLPTNMVTFLEPKPLQLIRAIFNLQKI